jgi:hypothetical protein
MGLLEIVLLVFIATVATVAGIGFYISNKKEEEK